MLLAIAPPTPDVMLGAMAAFPLAPAGGMPPPHEVNALAGRLWNDHRIEVPINFWPEWPSRVLRISAQVYNRLDQYRLLAGALSAEAENRQDPG